MAVIQYKKVSYRVLGGRNSAVECQLPKLDVAGSIPVARSNFSPYGSSQYSSGENTAFAACRARAVGEVLALAFGTGAEFRVSTERTAEDQSPDRRESRKTVGGMVWAYWR